MTVRSRAKQVLRPLVAKRIADARARRIAGRRGARYASMSISETFERIYREQTWGAENAEFDSGVGSRDRLTSPYIALVKRFIERHDIRSVVDLGCGDFRVGSALASSDLDYVGVDIVAPLIERNRALYARDGVAFECLDLASDRLPDADLGLLRQVLQHLSNEEIGRVLSNCRRYRYLIVTEHVPVGDSVVPNLDKPHGPDVRVYWRSGVFLEAPPFSLEVEPMLEVPLARGEVIRSVLLRDGGNPTP